MLGHRALRHCPGYRHVAAAPFRRGLSQPKQLILQFIGTGPFACWPHRHLWRCLRDPSSLLPRQGTVPAVYSGPLYARSMCYLFSSGSDPHSTLLGFCSIHFNSIQDALQHAKRLG